MRFIKSLVPTLILLLISIGVFKLLGIKFKWYYFIPIYFIGNFIINYFNNIINGFNITNIYYLDKNVTSHQNNIKNDLQKLEEEYPRAYFLEVDEEFQVWFQVEIKIGSEKKLLRGCYECATKKIMELKEFSTFLMFNLKHEEVLACLENDSVYWGALMYKKDSFDVYLTKKVLDL